jgi:hypothetical protein
MEFEYDPSAETEDDNVQRKLFNSLQAGFYNLVPDSPVTLAQHCSLDLS